MSVIGSEHGSAAGYRQSHRLRSSSNGRRHKSRQHGSGDELLGDRGVVVNMDNDTEAWGENTTCVTAATSERSISYEDVRQGHPQLKPGKRFVSSTFGPRMRSSQVCGLIIAFIICLQSFVSPIVMVVLPRLPLIENWNPTECTFDCEGLMIGFVFKLLILALGVWATFFRSSLAHYPRVIIARAGILALVFMMTFAFWLFYGVRILHYKETNYTHIVTFALSLVDAQLFVHYLFIVMIEIRHLRPEYRLRIVRSPDGESRTITAGNVSVQRAAVLVLQQYYQQFPVYNPFLEKLPTSRTARMKDKLGGGGGKADEPMFKVYDLDGPNDGVPMGKQHSQINPKAIIAAAARRRDHTHNDRFYDELEWERRMRKRRARLQVAADEAFLHVKRLQDEKGPCVPMDSESAAQAIFPSLSRSLTKYLRTTRQQPRHSAEQVVNHIATCLSFDMSPRAFLERFLNTQETPEASQRYTSWSIVSPSLVSRSLSHDTVFQLRCHTPGPDAGVFLMVHVTRLPFFDLTEQVIDPKANQFVLRLNSETSV